MEKNISKVKQRVLQFIGYLQISKRKFYLDTGVSNGLLDKETGMNEDTLEKIISTYSKINVDWLLTGKGEMLKKEPIDYPTSEPEEKNVSEPEISESRERLKLIAMLEKVQAENAKLYERIIELEKKLSITK